MVWEERDLKFGEKMDLMSLNDEERKSKAKNAF